MCSHCGLPFESKRMKAHWSTHHSELLLAQNNRDEMFYKEGQKLINPNPHWPEYVMKKLKLVTK